MAFGIAEDPVLSPNIHLDQVEYPVSREALAREAAESGAPADVINLFKSLPRTLYTSKEEAMRDLSEAARRFAMGNRSNNDDDAVRDRRNIGRDMVEGAPPGHTRHP